MKAIILAAGVGKRLKPLTDTTPKCLIRVGEMTILERMLDALTGVSISDICIVTGHLKEKIKLVAGPSYKGVPITYIPNPDYERGSILSVWAARNFFNDETIFMDADVIFEKTILEKLVSSDSENCFLMDKSLPADSNLMQNAEEMKIAAFEKRVVEISRHITQECDEIGEGVGFLKLSIDYRREFLDAFKGMIARDNNCDYENALNELVKKIPVGFEDVTGLKWTEIDFDGDIEKARELGI